MSLHRSLAVLLLAASLAGGVLAQGKDFASDDAAILARVEQALDRVHALVAARITVHSRDGFVTLTGFAATLEDVATAGRLTAAVHGVTGVSNRIRVANRASRA